MINNKKVLILSIFIFSVFILLPVASANNDTVYVAVDGSDDGNGSIEYPYLSISKAIDSDANTIILKNGTYNQSNINLNRSLTIIGQENAVLDGGNSWIVNITNRNCIVNLVNLTFINAHSNSFGAAVINNATLTVDNVKFINNSAYSAPAIDNSGSLILMNSYFDSNMAYGRDGGAISNVGNASVINSTFIHNRASRNAGAVKHQGNNFVIINSTFIANDAYGWDNYGGAVYIWASKAEIYNSTFKNNRGGYGGAVFVGGGNIESTGLIVKSSVFENNNAHSGKDLDINEGVINVSYSKILDGVSVLKTKDAVFDYNWWGENSPDFTDIITSPKPGIYAVLNLTSDENTVKAGVYWLNSSDVADIIPQLFGSITANATTTDNVDFSREYEFKVAEGSDVIVCIDREVQNLTVSSLIQTFLTAESVEMYYHDGSRFIVFLKDIDGNPLSNQSVMIRINGVEYNKTTNANGSASIGLNLDSADYAVDVVYNSQLEKYSGCNATSSVTILPTVEGSDVLKVFRNATQYYATFKDFNGNYLENGTMIQFNINGVLYNRSVKNGVAKLNLNLEAGVYILTALNTVTGEKSSNNIAILSKISENRDIVKYFRNGTQYIVKIIGDDGKSVGAGENVTFNINGVFYTRTTNASGIAKLNINLEPGDYIITAEYEGCKASNNIRVLSVIDSKDLDMGYRDGSKFHALILDNLGNPYSGREVTFNINGVFYTRITNSTGVASLNINLMRGKYIITSSYNGLNAANTITIH